MKTSIIPVLVAVLSCPSVFGFNLVMMGRRKGAGNLKRSLDLIPESDKQMSSSNLKSLNQGRGQEITGVTLPAEGKVKGWEFGKNQQIACANVDGKYYAIQGKCPRCAFDLFKGDIVTDEAFGKDIPRLACPTCATTYSLRTGVHGPALKRKGLAGFVGGLTKTATINEAAVNAKCFVITRDFENGRVFCRDQ